MISSKPSKNQKGQVLLLTMMLVATVLTVFLSMSFKSTTETQVTKLEEESQKALAAAEAGIEAALKEGNVTIGQGTLSSLSGFSGSAICSEEYDKTYFISPLIQKDEQYTFYLAKYDTSTHSFSDYYSNDITLYYGSQTSCNDIGLEITLLYYDDATSKNKVIRWIADSSNMFGPDTSDISGSTGDDLGGVHFDCSTSAIDISSVTKPKLLIVRSFGAATQVGFSGSSALKPQGKICDANATSSTVTKKLYLLQSYPQIPAEFFVTSF